jgi:hypothetical protein
MERHPQYFWFVFKRIPLFEENYQIRNFYVDLIADSSPTTFRQKKIESFIGRILIINPENYPQKSPPLENKRHKVRRLGAQNFPMEEMSRCLQELSDMKFES